MATSAERMRACRERARRGLRRLTGGKITINCDQCGKQIKVSYDDGHAAQTMSLDLNENYVWYWSQDRWEISKRRDWRP
jgi:hypothetical protein